MGRRLRQSFSPRPTRFVSYGLTRDWYARTVDGLLPDLPAMVSGLSAITQIATAFEIRGSEGQEILFFEEDTQETGESI